jgi:uncharacterized protein (TIGR03067 family)
MSPKGIYLMPMSDDANGDTWKGIYSLDGHQLKICTRRSPSDAVVAPDRPTEFKTAESDTAMIEIFKRKG